MNDLSNWDDYSDFSDDNDISSFKFNEDVLKDNLLKKYKIYAQEYFNEKELIDLINLYKCDETLIKSKIDEKISYEKKRNEWRSTSSSKREDKRKSIDSKNFKDSYRSNSNKKQYSNYHKYQSNKNYSKRIDIFELALKDVKDNNTHNENWKKKIFKTQNNNFKSEEIVNCDKTYTVEDNNTTKLSHNDNFTINNETSMTIGSINNDKDNKTDMKKLVQELKRARISSKDSKNVNRNRIDSVSFSYRINNEQKPTNNDEIRSSRNHYGPNLITNMPPAYMFAPKIPVQVTYSYIDPRPIFYPPYVPMHFVDKPVILYNNITQEKNPKDNK